MKRVSDIVKCWKTLKKLLIQDLSVFWGECGRDWQLQLAPERAPTSLSSPQPALQCSTSSLLLREEVHIYLNLFY